MNSNEKLRAKRLFDRKYRQLERKYAPMLHAAANLQIQNTTILVKTVGIERARNALNTYLYNTEVSKVLTRLFKEMALWAANYAYKQVNKYVRAFKRKDTGAFGFDEDWNKDIELYLQQYLLKRAVLPITDTIKQDILEALKLAQENGWGIDRTIQELDNMQSDTSYLARMRARTELSNAANFGYKMAEDKIPFETNKIWIAANDNRTRNAHRLMDNVAVDSYADFHVPIIKKKQTVGIDLMTGPGDPEASAGNVINCRCTLGFEPKRDKNGRLIKKQTHNSL